ncbi:MAG: serine/threonine protein kinase [Anaerolineae bacterium]|nr:serine/threonine protein kinase [Anaerolineae bacterium]
METTDPNPYVHKGKPIRTFKNFFGRKYALSKITDDIRNEQCISVVGIRRIGKTSLLFQMQDPHARASYHLGDDVMCIYFTFHRTPRATPGEIYAEITRKVYQRLSQNRLSTLIEFPEKEVNYHTFEKTIVTIQEAGIKLVLLMDDFEILADNPNLDLEFFLGLRALHTEYSLTYVTASVVPLRELDFHHKEILSSPFFNVFDSVRLGLFSENESLEFIRVAKVFSPDTEDFLLILTGGHPLALQHACHCAYARYQETGKKLTRKDQFTVWNQTEKVMEDSYRAYWQHLSLDQKRVLAAPAYFATHTKEGTPIENLFKDLVTQGLLIRYPNGNFDYAGRLFADFVRQEISHDVSLRAALPDNLVGETLGNYQLTERLGRGGMGDVYKAYDSNLARDVVVKIMLPHLANDKGFNDRFRREAQAIASLRHQNIVQIYDFSQQNNLYYMVMEYVAGQDLQVYLQTLQESGEQMPLTDALHIIRQIGSALDYAHNRGILHRDIKPSNVMLRANKEAILTDFGIVKIISETKTTSSSPIGTPAYMAPEQIDLSYPVDQRADVYALGILFYEMLAGSVPFQANSSEAILNQHLVKPLPDLRQYRLDIPDNVFAILEKMLAKNPEQRYQNAYTLLSELEDIEMSLQEQKRNDQDTFPGIPFDLYNKLFDTLCVCAPVNSDRELRAIFIDKRLCSWQHALPEAGSPESRIKVMISLLYNKRSATQENGLVLFLRVLKDQTDPSDDCHQRLANLAQELENL